MHRPAPVVFVGRARPPPRTRAASCTRRPPSSASASGSDGHPPRRPSSSAQRARPPRSWDRAVTPQRPELLCLGRRSHLTACPPRPRAHPHRDGRPSILGGPSCSGASFLGSLARAQTQRGSPPARTMWASCARSRSALRTGALPGATPQQSSPARDAGAVGAALMRKARPFCRRFPGRIRRPW